jgi:hypothetical protein
MVLGRPPIETALTCITPHFRVISYISLSPLCSLRRFVQVTELRISTLVLPSPAELAFPSRLVLVLSVSRLSCLYLYLQ